ncbi:hypothetical protein F5Y00DRAFT_240414 [Daldinia vernicosa]|uniref:uncharacterized protein n=1 Tax=Daldinia vernicosa TaxID=114800 RepID=UPI002008466B|nr:uncharacterized protein F5Y00DRAFT_240414 [Daldinia vernicosa]KAI0847787.1 hypothetical protein F5Y00DRAFT_240414 [Daldinia vernicosa]
MPETGEETPPPHAMSSRIKRNTACTSCRDAKVRCNPSQNPAQPCQRCAKLHLTCVVDKTHKRVSRKSKLDELVQEIQSIKQSVSGQSASLPSQTAEFSPQNEVLTPLKESVPPRLGVPSPISVSADVDGRAPVIIATTTSTTVAPSSVIHTPASIPLIQGPAPEPALPRALGSQPFSGEDVEYYFQKYFEHYHPYMPVVRHKDPNKCYDTSPLLFWTIIYVATRRYAKNSTIFPFMLDSIKRDAYSAIANPPLSLTSINALILLCTWIFPDVRFVNDPCALFSSICMSATAQLGIHCGKGAHPEYSHGVFQNNFTDEEASFTWAGYNIISQRVSEFLGLPPLGCLFNQTIQNVIDGRIPFQVPSNFRILLECQKFCNHVSKTMSVSLEDARGVSAKLVQLLEDEWNAVRGLICSERAGDLDRFNALLVQLEIQTYYMMPLPGYNPDALKRNILRTYNTAQVVIRESLELDDKVQFLRHIPHFHLRALASAGCIIFRVLRSSYMSFIDRKAAERSAADIIIAARRVSIMEADLPARLGNLLESWSDWLLAHGDPAAAQPPPRSFPQLQWSEEPVSAFSHRLSASVTFDCMTRWKNDHRHNALRCKCQSSGASGASSTTPAPGTAGGTNGCETPAAMAGSADALQNIDWTFMDDFDWSFEPIMPVLTAPT